MSSAATSVNTSPWRLAIRPSTTSLSANAIVPALRTVTSSRAGRAADVSAIPAGEPVLGARDADRDGLAGFTDGLA